MSIWERFLAFLAAILPEDDELVTRLTDAEPGDAEAMDFPEDSTEERQALLVATYNVSDDDIEAAEQAIRDAAFAEDADGNRVLESAQVLEAAELMDEVRFVEEVRDDAATAEQAAVDAALASIAGEDADPEADPDADPEDADPEDPENPDDGGDPQDPDPEDPADPEAAADPELEPVVASATPAQARASSIRRVAAAARTRPRSERVPVVAADASRGHTWHLLDRLNSSSDLGSDIDGEAFFAAAADRLADLGAAGANGGIKLGRVEREFPEDRTLGEDAAANGRRIQRMVASAQEEAMAQATPGDAIDILTAAGGICALPEPIRTIAREGTTDRPVYNFLPSLNAAYGGVTQRPGMKLSAIGDVDTANSGITWWTAANDAAPGDDGPATKQVLVVSCPDEYVTTSIDALVTRLQFGTFQERYDPDSVATFAFLQEVAQARAGDTRALTQINARSVQVTAPDPVVGFAREYLDNLEWLVDGIRSSNRLPETFVFDYLQPFWVHTAMRSDLMRELPGSVDDRLATANAQIDEWFRIRGLRTGYFIDTQQLGIQGAGAQAARPTSVKGYLFEPGHHVMLDGGRWDFGVRIVDSTLLDTNDLQTFGETTENVHSAGLWSYALTQELCMTGATSGTVDVLCGDNPSA